MVENNDDLNCELQFNIQSNAITIRTLQPKCGFGARVDEDGTFELTNSETPQFFVTMEGPKIYFSKVSPEEYNK